MPVDPPRFRLANFPTPLIEAPRALFGDSDTRVWIKRDDMTAGPETGNKIRKLEFTVAEALAQDCDTLITCGGVQSNHCRATALVGASLGLDVRLVLRGRPDSVIDGNLLLDHLAGAAIRFIDGKTWAAHLDDVLEEEAAVVRAAGGRPWIIPTGASDAIGVWGYAAASVELATQYEAAGFLPDAVVHATGSGGTQAGLVAGHLMAGLDTDIVGIAVSDDDGYFQAKVRADLDAWQTRYQPEFGKGRTPQGWPIEVLDGYVGPGYGRAGPEIYDTIRHAARTAGLVVDPVYTGKALHALRSELAPGGRFHGLANVVFIHTGGVFGLFPERESVLG